MFSILELAAREGFKRSSLRSWTLNARDDIWFAKTHIKSYRSELKMLYEKSELSLVPFARLGFCIGFRPALTTECGRSYHDHSIRALPPKYAPVVVIQQL